VPVQSGNWGEGEIVGADIVEACSGRVVCVTVVPGRSTTNLVNKMREG